MRLSPLAGALVRLVVVLCAPAASLAGERYVCTPGVGGTGWSCTIDESVPAVVPPVAARRAPGTAVARTASASPARTLDWVAWDALPPAVRATTPAYCGGAYVEPPFPVALDADPSTFPVVANATAVEYWVGERAELRGDVRIAQGNRSLTTEHATYREANGSVEIVEALVMREPGILMVGESADVALDSGAAIVDASRFVIHGAHLRGGAAAIARDEAGNLEIRNGRFTRCEPGNDSWMLRSSRIVIEKDANFGSARNAVIRVRDVPVFYTPYISFPVTDERLSGFLFPDMGYSEENGVDIAVPYYLNLAPNYDATLTPRWISERGTLADLEVRHLSTWSETEFGGAYLPEDELYDGNFARDDFDDLGIPGEFEPTDRWFSWIRHQGGGNGFSTFADIADVSDDDYLRDLGNDFSIANESQIERRGEIEYGNGGLLVTLWGQDFKVLDDDTLETYRRLPELAVSYRRPGLGPFAASIAASTAEFERNNEVFVGVDRMNGRRTHVEPRIELPWRRPFGFARLTSGLRYTQYDLVDEPAGLDDHPSRDLWFGVADGGLVFEREASFFGDAAVHTLEPRLYYLAQQREDQSELPRFDTGELTFGYSQLFRDNRFAGLDRIGDANQLSAGFTTRFLGESTGREYLRASLGQIFYFEDREVTLTDIETSDERHSTSAFAGESSLLVGDRWSGGGNVVWDPHENDWSEVGAYLRYRGPERDVFSVGFRRLYDYGVRLRQVDASFYLPWLRRFALLGRAYYDFEVNTEMDVFGGVEYNDCCWRLRLVGRRFLQVPGSGRIEDGEMESGVFLQIVFKGLAGFGGKIDRMIEKGIVGFEPEDI